MTTPTPLALRPAFGRLLGRPALAAMGKVALPPSNPRWSLAIWAAALAGEPLAARGEVPEPPTKVNAGIEAPPLPTSVEPTRAWSLVQAGDALLVDVRSSAEYRFVGHVPGSLHLPWAEGLPLIRNPLFLRELEALVADAATPGFPVLLLCRSGKRSALAAQAAARAGVPNVWFVREGFEGERNDAKQRGRFDGWRFHGLPWVQD
jgi:rhodanese-related sulfurtransferase